MKSNFNIQKANSIKTFFSSKNVAFVGVSRDKKKFTYNAYEKVLKHNWNVFPVNPALDSIDGNKCYSSVLDIPDQLDALISMVPKSITKSVLEQAKQRNINNIWIQQKSETPEALQFARENKMNLVSGECILMYAEPVDSVHKFHRWINKIFKKYPL